MNLGLLFTIISVFYVLMATIVYFSKPRIRLLENKIYEYILFSTLLGFIILIISYILDIYFFDLVSLRYFFSKIYYVYLLTFVFLITLYIIFSSMDKYKTDKILEEKPKDIIIPIITFYIILIAIGTVLPFEYYVEDSIIYLHGLGTNYVYIIFAIAIVFWTGYIIKNFKRLIKRKYIPIIVFILVSGPVMYLQFLFPELVLETIVASFMIVCMFFTIENPDLVLINQLNIAKEQAEKANLAKTEFLSSMSHEVRTPLNAIVGFSQSIEEQDIPDNIRDDLQYIKAASNTLLELVNGILDISKIEADKVEIINTEYNIEKLLDEVSALAKTKIGEKPLDFRTNFDKNLPRVLYGDHFRLKQILINLLTNAMKYTEEGYVEFKVDIVKKDDICRLIITIEDTGIGIKNEEIDKLFEKFERLNVSKFRSIEGTGLGLAITKKLVELMNGQILVHSEYGVGSKFTVAIDQRVIMEPSTVDLEKTMTLDLKDLKFDNNKVLIVDDNKINLKVAARLLSNYNVKIDEVSSGQECLDKITSGVKYELILLDDMMPHMSGVETLKKLREIKGFNTPIVALTANAIVGMREKYLNDGFDDYIPKPIERDQLNKLVVKFLEKKK